MIDPRRVAILIRSQIGDIYQDRTSDVYQWERTSVGANIVFKQLTETKSYSYREDSGKLLVLERPYRELLEGRLVEVRGSLWLNVSEVLRFGCATGSWTRVFYSTKGGESYKTYLSSEVRILTDIAKQSRATKILNYWHDLVNHLPNLKSGPNPLVHAYESMEIIHPDSVLAHYLSGKRISEKQDGKLPLFPFSSNLSQRDALLQALKYPISVIDGPPGTGKTQTILNLLATLSAMPGVCIGVVSATNTAVDNVRDKLDELGFGYVIANLGNKDRKEAFFAAQEDRNTVVDNFLASSSSGTRNTSAESVVKGQLRVLEGKLLKLQENERTLARLRQSLDSYRLEYRHFTRYLNGYEVANLDGVVLLDRASDRILDYLVETQLPESHLVWPLRWIKRLRQQVKYGSLKDVDPTDSDVVLRLQRAYYEKKISEFEEQVITLEDELFHGDLKKMVAQQQKLSLQVLRTGLRERYSALERKQYDEAKYLDKLDAFSVDYPIILSTCHSLRQSVGQERLLDYLIIDEASQVDLLAAGLALASTKRVIVVGDLAQLPHIPVTEAVDSVGISSPLPAYDYVKHSLLSSLQELYGDKLPRTMLCEHYRCDPAIIGFCNEKFYGQKLIPFTTSTPEHHPLILHTTTEGNHMRSHREGGLSNQREVDVIEQEVIPRYCTGISRDEIGIVSPYRKQVGKINDILVGEFEEIEADTVHRFQGREKQAIIMSTVLDETWRGRLGTSFIDDPHLVNVAVSRAKDKFVLVTDHDMLPTSKNLRDLMGYIQYYDPEHQPYQSSIVSVFDLLYRNYSARLESLFNRVLNRTKYRSENIIWTVIQDILAEEPYHDLNVHAQVLVQNLLLGLEGLTEEETTYVKNRCSLDFVVYRRVTRQPVLAIEVNGFAFHENNPKQHTKDTLKKAILDKNGIPLLALPTTGSGEQALIRAALNVAMNR
ncbi:MAG: AAA family ATPase [Propionibacteriaceae bacterium]|jgi:hypothetical protein|nr:AAA family ATPase [Propionibacteriaceae bacterium]